MQKCIAFLRGINVGGHRKIAMSDLKNLFLENSYTDIETYIQSGNVIFSKPEISSFRDCEQKLEFEILKKFGFDVPVIVRSKEEIKWILNSNPFLNEPSIDTNRLFVTFLSDIPTSENVQLLEKTVLATDKFIIREKDIFMYCSGNYSDTKLTIGFFETKLKVRATSRNWNTLLKVFEKADK